MSVLGVGLVVTNTGVMVLGMFANTVAVVGADFTHVLSS